MSIEELIKNMSEDDLKQLTHEFYKQKNKIPTYQYSKVTKNFIFNGTTKYTITINLLKFKRFFLARITILVAIFNLLLIV